jgi:hypothetical protein
MATPLIQKVRNRVCDLILFFYEKAIKANEMCRTVTVKCNDKCVSQREIYERKERFEEWWTSFFDGAYSGQLWTGMHVEIIR